MKKILNHFHALAIFAASVSTVQFVSAQTIWTGSSGQNWSTTGNWSTSIVPGTSDIVVFTNNASAATSAGTVDNIVDGSFAGSVASLQFANTNGTGSGTGFYHNTQIGAGQTLTVLGDLRTGFDPDIANCTINAGFSGAGTLIVSNTTAGVNVSQGDNGNAAQAILNMTNLNNFNATIGGVTVGVYKTPNPAVARQKGFLYLAKTNVINLLGFTSRGTGNQGQIEVGENLGNGSNIQIPMYLGIVNNIFVNSVTIGADKQGSGALFAFNPVFTNAGANAFIRGTNGNSSRVSVWKVGDNSNQSTTGSGCAGTVDLSNGSLDAMIDTLIVGEGESGASSGTGNGVGTFTFNSGTNNVNTLYLGYRVATGGNSAPPGTMNVSGMGTLLVNSAICLSFYVNGSGTTYGSGTLNITNGTVLANTITNGVSGGLNTTANINVNGGTLGITSLAGGIGTVAAPIKNLTLNNATLQLKVSGVQTNVETYALNAIGTTNVINIGYLPPINSYPAIFPLIGVLNGVGSLNIGVSNLPPANPAFQGYISNDVNTIYLVVTNGPVGVQVATWSGATDSNWDSSTINWMLGGTPAAYTDGNATLFDDTASTGAVNLTTSLLPASVTVSNNTLNYAFGGSGNISGSGGLTKYGTGSLLITNGAANDFLGNVTINAGAVQFGNGGTTGILPTSGSVLDNGNLIFNRSGNVTVPNTISGSGTFTKNGTSTLTLSAANSFNGAAVINSGALVVNGILSGTLTNAAGAIVGGAGTNAGAMNISGTVQPSAGSGTPATFTSGGDLSLSSGANLAFNLNATNTTTGSGINDLISVGGNLNLNNNALTLNVQGVPQSGSTYTLVNFSGSKSGSFNSTIAGTHFGAAVNQSSSPITVTFSGSGANLKWDSTTDNNWNVGSNSNWLNSASQQDVFYQGDNVAFDDSVVGVVSNLTIPTGVSVSPTIISNNSSSVNYSIAGPGQISGNVSIIKQGSSTLTISSANNNFTGVASVQGGTLRVGNNNAFGASGTVMATNGGTIDLNGAGLGEVTVVAAGSGVGGNGAIVSSGADQIHAVNIVKLSGDSVFGGSGRWDIRANGAINASLGTLDNTTHNLVKKGTNLVALVTCAIDPTIGDIDVQGGSFALQLAGTSQNSGTWFGDTSHTISVENGGELSFNTLGSAYPIYRTIALNDGSLLTSSAGDNGIGGNVILTGNATISVTGGAFPWLLVSGTISGSGNLIVNGTLPMISVVNNTYTGNTLINAGTLMLVNDGAISTSSNIIVAAGAALDVSQRSDSTLTLTSGQTLQGNGSVNGIVVVGSGATISAGPDATTIGMLTITNSATLQGSARMKLNAATLTSDELNITAGTGITYGGTLTVTNISATSFAANNSFKLFNAATYSGAFSSISPATPGAGLGWDTNSLTVDGTLKIISVGPPPTPHITGISLSGTTLTINATNGTLGGQFVLLQSTNVALPLAQWTPVLTNQFDGSGNLSLSTNIINPNNSQEFYILSQ